MGGRPALAFRAPAAAGPTVLTAGQYALLSAVLNRIIPGRDGLPGAGDLGVVGALDRTMAASPVLRRLLLEGLTVLEIAAAGHGDTATGFIALAGEGQDVVLRVVERQLPAFFAAFPVACSVM